MYFCTKFIRLAKMNYEELLESRNGSAMSKEQIPFGQLYKKLVDNKYVNVVDLRADLLDSLVFTDALHTESETNQKLIHKNQLHFTLDTDSAGLYGIRIEQGNYNTFERLLESTPAIVASKNFIADTVRDLLDNASYLHDQGIFHLCYAPSNILARKGDNAPMLLMHGSAYQVINDQQALYGEQAATFIAPEVLDEGVCDARADIYSIGKFMEWLYRQSEVPFEIKGVIKKATAADPDKRYQTPEEMASDITKRRNIRSSLVMGVSALAIGAVIIGLYFTLVPERENIEFITPSAQEHIEGLPDEGVYDPSTESYVTADVDDTLDVSQQLDPRKLKEYEAKAEQIFRKQYAREAERILSGIYNNERMNVTEKKFAAGSQSTIEELVKAQVKMGHDAGLSNSRSQIIATEIIDKVSEKLKAEMAAKEKADTERPKNKEK